MHTCGTNEENGQLGRHLVSVEVALLSEFVVAHRQVSHLSFIPSQPLNLPSLPSNA